MLFSFDDEYLLKDYFNLTKTRDEILSPKEGLILGNMFSDEYEPYKNYRPSEIKINSETEELNKDETIVEKQIPSPGIKAYKGSNVYLN